MKAWMPAIAVSLVALLSSSFNPLGAESRTQDRSVYEDGSTSAESKIVEWQAANRADTLFHWALRLTRYKQFQRAIAALESASELFAQQGDLENAYKSKALARYLAISEAHRKASPGTHSLPTPYSGLCLEDCEYGMVYVNPKTEIEGFGGIIALEQEIDRVDYGNGSSTPVNAILSLAVVPAYDRDTHFLSSTCQYKDEYVAGLFAIARHADYEDAELYSDIQQAWKANLKTETIETIPTNHVACINHCPGGC